MKQSKPRLPIYPTPDLLAWLREQAAERGETVSATVCRLLWEQRERLAAVKRAQEKK